MEAATQQKVGREEARPGGGARGSWRFAAALFAVAVALRVAYVLALRSHPRFDAPVMDAGYHLAWARALASGDEYQDGPFFRAPLYPVVLAGLLKVGGGGLLFPRLVQAVLGGVSSVLTYRLGARVVGERAGQIAGALVALSWILIGFDGELLIPALLVPLLLVALERAASWNGDDRPMAALGTGLAFGLAAIARPNVLLFMPWLFAWSLVRSRRPRAALLLAAGTLIPIAPVTLHNALEGDRALIATQAGVNLWIGNNPSSDGVTAIVPGTREGWFEGYRDAIAQAEAAEGRDLAPTEVSSHYLRRALGWAADHPGDALAHLAWKARLLVTNVELANNQDIEFTARRTLPLLRYSPTRWDVLLGLGVVGLALALRSRRPAAWMLVAFTLTYAFSIVLFFVNARFRVPLIPPLAIGAGFAIVELAAALRRRHRVQAACIAGGAVLLALGSNVVPSAIDRTDANGLADLGRAELGRGRPKVALGYLEEAIAANPRSVQVRMALASAVLAAEEAPRRAVRLLEEAQELPLGRDNTELAARLLDARINAGEARAVVVDARAALAQRPSDGALRFVLGRALAASGKARAGLVVLRELFIDEPQNAGAALAIARIVDRVGSPTEQREAWQAVLDLGDLAAPAVQDAARAKLGSN